MCSYSVKIYQHFVTKFTAIAQEVQNLACISRQKRRLYDLLDLRQLLKDAKVSYSFSLSCSISTTNFHQNSA